MNDDSVKVAVKGLLQVRKQHRAYTGETVPQSLDHAYKIQDSLVNELGENIVVWKIGCTSKMAHEM